MNRVLITGANGQLGRELRRLTSHRQNFVYSDIVAGNNTILLDITDKEAVKKIVNEMEIDKIINCAAYTDVDEAENNQELCYRVNVDGVSNLVDALAPKGGSIIQISTNCVFDGEAKRIPYRENDRTRPLSVYGDSKLKAEQLIEESGCRGAIIRTSWLFSPYSKSFVKTMMNKGKTNNVVNVASDQVSTPTYAADLAAAIVKMLPHVEKMSGEIYNYSNSGSCSLQLFAAYTMIYAGLKCRVQGVDSEASEQIARRPRYSVLDKAKIEQQFGLVVPPWKDSLKSCILRIKRSGEDI